MVARTSAPIINHPWAVARTGRAEHARRLCGLTGVIAPDILPITRRALLQNAPRLEFPLLVRSPGFHTGQNFVRVETRAVLAAAIADLPGDDLLAIQPLDARGVDDLCRKYRVMFIDGALHPIHMAVSRDWKVHYFSGDMASNQAHRREEAAFLTNMAAVLGWRAMAALKGIGAAMALDYAGVDFGLAQDGRLILFEANAGMVLQPPGPEAIWDYRRPPIHRALEAVRDMLLRRAAALTHSAA